MRRIPDRSTILLAVIVLMIVALPGVGSATSGEMTIDRDTVLTEDHHGPIVIAAGGVTLDCDGYTVVGGSAGYGILVNGPSDVTVRNCWITGFDQGIRALNLTGLVIEDNVLYDNVGDGIHLAYVSSSVIAGNLSIDNDGNGLWAAWVEDVEVSSNSLHGNLINGFALYSSESVLAERNRAFRNADIGFKVRRTVDSSFLWNRADRNGEGFHLGEINSNLFFKNKAMANIVGYNVWREDPQFLDAADNSFIKNKALANSGFGFIDDLGGLNVYDHNVCDGNGIEASDPAGLCD